VNYAGQYVKQLNATSLKMNPKKIIFVHLLNDYSGSPKVLSQVIAAFQNQGGLAHVYTGRSDEGFLSGVTENHHFYFYKRFENKFLTLFSFALSQLVLFFKLLKYHRDDVAVYVNTLLPFGAALAGRAMGKPVYYHVHEISLRPLALKRFLRWIAEMTASKIIFVSQAVHDCEGFGSKRQWVVNNALPEHFLRLANQYPYEWQYDGHFNVLMVCSLKAYKGILEFVDIANLLSTDRDIRFTLVLNADASEIQAFFARMVLPTHLSWVPRQNDLTAYYQKASVLLNLSRVDEWVETFGLTIIEAMAFGVPVIVPPVGGPASIVTEGVEGFLISSYETQRIADCVRGLSKDKAKCLDLSDNARYRVKDFSHAHFDDSIVRILSE
jgi:glycosyltransferase involved in cell wall biosynthesis